MPDVFSSMLSSSASSRSIRSRSMASEQEGRRGDQRQVTRKVGAKKQSGFKTESGADN